MQENTIAVFGRKNRGKIEIMADILSLSASGSTRKTHIMYGVKLSYRQTLSYLEELQGNGLLEALVKDGASTYRMTEKGREFLALFSNISTLMNGQQVQVYERSG